MKSTTAPQAEALSIGQASQLTGLSARTIRHYEATGIISRATRGRSGYRRFSREDVRTLQFVRNARSLRFDLREIGRMVQCWREGTCPDAAIVDLLAHRVRKLRRQEKELRSSRVTLEDMLRLSAERERPDCGIVSMLVGDTGPLLEADPSIK